MNWWTGAWQESPPLLMGIYGVGKYLCDMGGKKRGIQYNPAANPMTCLQAILVCSTNIMGAINIFWSKVWYMRCNPHLALLK